MKKKIDVQVSGSGSVYLLTGISKAGKAWMKRYLPQDMRYAGGIAVEHRFINAILEGMTDDGLVLSRVQ